MSTQLSFWQEDSTDELKNRIKKLETKIDNIRKGLFKRQTSEKKTLDHLENEVEELLHRYIQLFEEPYGDDSPAPDTVRTGMAI